MAQVDGLFDKFLGDIAPGEADQKNVAAKRILYRSAGEKSLPPKSGFREDAMGIDLDAFEMPVGSQALDSVGGKNLRDPLHLGGKQSAIGSGVRRITGVDMARSLSLETPLEKNEVDAASKSGSDDMSVDASEKESEDDGLLDLWELHG